MIAADIFVRSENENQNLPAFAEKVSNVLGFTALSERESSNYANGHYFTAASEDSKVNFAYLDTEGFEEWVFLISFEPAHPGQSEKMAQALAAAGFQCYVPEGAWYRTSWVPKGASYGL